MALSENDLERIGQVVDEKITREIGSLRLEMNQRFDSVEGNLTAKIDGVEEGLTTKIEEIKQMETEDIQVLYKDVALLKKKMAV